MAEDIRHSPRLECKAILENRLKEIFRIINGLEQKAPELIAKLDAATYTWVYSLPTAAEALEKKYIYNYEAIRTIEGLLESLEDPDIPSYLEECHSDVIDRLNKLFFVYDDNKRELKLADLKGRLVLATRTPSSAITSENVTLILGGRRSRGRRNPKQLRRRTYRH